jgi:hypothetical protein
MTKITIVQLKAIAVAVGHLEVGNGRAFWRIIGSQCRGAANEDQEQRILQMADVLIRSNGNPDMSSLFGVPPADAFPKRGAAQ